MEIENKAYHSLVKNIYKLYYFLNYINNLKYYQNL